MTNLKQPISNGESQNSQFANYDLQLQPISNRGQIRILIAGIGNIFMGDDGFGCEVVRALRQRELPTGVKVEDFAIRGYDLAYALTEPYETVILVDAASQRAAPGTVFLLIPAVEDLERRVLTADAHAMNPAAVLRMAELLGGIKAKLYLLGCEPRYLDSDSGQIGLSDEVRSAIPRALEMIEGLLNELLQNEPTNAGSMPVERTWK